MRECRYFLPDPQGSSFRHCPLLSPSHSRRFRSPSIDWASAAPFNQRHFPAIDRNHHACGVGVDFNRKSLGLSKELTWLACLSPSCGTLMSLGRRCCGTSGLQEGLADALVDDFDRWLIGQTTATRSRQLRLRHGVRSETTRSGRLSSRSLSQLFGGSAVSICLSASVEADSCCRSQTRCVLMSA